MTYKHFSHNMEQRQGYAPISIAQVTSFEDQNAQVTLSHMVTKLTPTNKR